LSGKTYNLKGVHFTDANIGTVVGYDSGSWPSPLGIILRTTDGGKNWINQNCGVNSQLHAISFTDTNVGWIVGGDGYANEKGIILKTTDGGNSWISQSSNLIVNGLYDVYFTDANNGTAVGSSWDGTSFGIILRTTDGGTSWVSNSSGTNSYLTGVSFADADKGTVVGSGNIYPHDGIILRTTDGGSKWVNQSIGINNELHGVCFTDALTGWAVGEGGAILHTTNGGVTFIKEKLTNEEPTEFMLSQNFPNPLNSSTNIRYSVPYSSNVIIKVFNILGAEIETLVNEEKPAGYYELTWNAANLPSGLYFYRIQAGSFVETKKMILLK
jgi:photosystem II stability/assembly factor-like uncharacterized protein